MSRFGGGRVGVQTPIPPGTYVPTTVLTTNGDLLTRTAGVPDRVTRASLAADTAFTTAFVQTASAVQYVRTTLDGVTSNSAAIQAAHDALPATGGDIVLLGSTNDYILGLSIQITKPNVTIKRWGPVTIKRAAGAVTIANAATQRGMFMLADLQPANFRIEEGIKLDGNYDAYISSYASTVNYDAVTHRATLSSGTFAAPLVAGVYFMVWGAGAYNGGDILVASIASRDSDTQLTLNSPPFSSPTETTVTGKFGMGGWNSSAGVYALRCTDIYLDGVIATGFPEGAAVFRNCGRTFVRGCKVTRCWNNGIEWNNLVDGASPTLGTYVVTDSDFEDCNDFLRGNGNGAGLVIGGSNTGACTGVHWCRNRFKRNWRDAHHENNSGGWLQDFFIDDNESEGALQNGLAVVHGRDGSISRNKVRNAGTSTALTHVGAPDVAAIILTGATSRNVTIDGNIVDDDRASTTHYTRHGIKVTGCESAKLTNNAVRAGQKNAGDTSSLFSAGIRIQNVTGSLLLSGNVVIAPSPGAGATSSFGIDFTSGNTGILTMPATNLVSGWATGLGNAAALTFTTPDLLADIVFANTANRLIRASTADAADTRRLTVCGGGGSSDNRGASLALCGNEESQTGRFEARTGNVSGAAMSLQWLGTERILGDVNGLSLAKGAAGKLGFYTATPVVQPARVGQLTDSSGGTSGGATIAVVTDNASAANAIATLAAKINALEAKLSAAGGGIGVTA